MSPNHPPTHTLPDTPGWLLALQSTEGEGGCPISLGRRPLERGVLTWVLLLTLLRQPTHPPHLAWGSSSSGKVRRGLCAVAGGPFPRVSWELLRRARPM